MILTTPASLYVFASLAAATMIALILFLTLVTLPRIQGVQGYLDASQGVINVRGIGDGIVGDLVAKPGERVEKGDILFKIDAIASGDADAGAGEVAHRHLVEQKTLAAQALTLQEQLSKEKLDELFTQKRNTKQRVALLVKQQDSLKQLASTVSLRLARIKNLNEQGLAAEAQLEEAMIAQHEIHQDLFTIERLIDEVVATNQTIDHQIKQARFTQREEGLSSQKAILDIDKQINELVNKQVIVIRSPVDGLITAVNAVNGQHLETNGDVVRILPDGSSLVARFPVSSAAVGLVEEGQDIQLRYQAFPFQKYGVHYGHVTSVSPTAATTQTESMSDDSGGGGRLFMIEAVPHRDHVMVAGKPRPLLPEMTVEGAIVLERRTILEWFLEPLLAIRGNL